jgi:hypothetical protein
VNVCAGARWGSLVIQERMIVSQGRKWPWRIKKQNRTNSKDLEKELTGLDYWAVV